MNNSDFRKLRELREDLEGRFDYFPHNRCEDSAEEVKKLFGWKVIVGSIRDPFREKYMGEHFWNYCSETGEYIDLTLDQFRELEPLRIKPVTIVHKDSKIAREIYRPRYSSEVNPDAQPAYI